MIKKLVLVLAVLISVFAQAGEPPEDEYIALSYIESTGTQYINTEIAGNCVYGLELGMSVVSVLADTQTYLGCKANHFVICSKATGAAWIRLCTRGVQRHADNTEVFDADRCNVVAVTNGAFTVNGNLVPNTTEFSSLEALSTDASPVCLAALPNGSKPSAIRIYWAKIYDSTGALLSDLVPVKTMDGMIGLYDCVTDTFKDNAGTGEFIAGPTLVTTLTIAGEPVAYGTPSPVYGLTRQFAVGAIAHLESPASWATADDDLHAEVIGWKLLRADGSELSGSGNVAEFLFTDETSGGRFTWIWRQKFRVDLKTKCVVGGAIANGGYFWTDWDGKVRLDVPEIPASADRFGYWEGHGVTGVNMLDQPIELNVATSGVVTASFVQKWTLDNSTATDGNWTISLSTGVIDGERAWALNSTSAGSGVLDLTHFAQDVESQQKIRSIANNLFANNTIIEAFIAPDLHRVSHMAFSGAINLRRLVFSDAVTFSGDSNFKDCISLARIDPRVVTNQTSFGAYVFFRCGSLHQSFNYPNLQTINGHYFAAQAGFTSIHAPKLRTISGAGSFESTCITGCVNLASAEDLETAFARSPLTELIAPNCLHIGGMSYCPNLTNVVLSANMTNLINSAFEGCSKLQGFSPRKFKRLRTIGSDAFKDCSELGGGFSFLRKGELGSLAGCYSGTKVTNFVFRSSVSFFGRGLFPSCPNVHIYFYQSIPPEINTSDYDTGLPYYQTCWLHVANGLSSTAWQAFITNNAGADDARKTRRDTEWANMQNNGTVPDKCFGILFFSFMPKYVLDWQPPESGFSVSVY